MYASIFFSKIEISIVVVELLQCILEKNMKENYFLSLYLEVKIAYLHIFLYK